MGKVEWIESTRLALTMTRNSRFLGYFIPPFLFFFFFFFRLFEAKHFIEKDYKVMSGSPFSGSPTLRGEL